MPKLKQPKTLEDLSIAALVKRVSQKAREAIGSGTQINISDLNDYLYAELPRVLSDRVTTRMLPEVLRSLANDFCRNKNANNVAESIILSITYHDISCLDLSRLPQYAIKILSCYIQTYRKLQTLIFHKVLRYRDDDLPTDAIQTLPIGLSFLKLLVDFEMHGGCTDGIIVTLGFCCSGTIERIDIKFCREVTDASFKVLIKCHKLKYLSIFETSVTTECYVQFLKNIQQHKKSDDTAKDFLHVGVGANLCWDVSTRQLNEIARSCPKLKEMEISRLDGDLEALVGLTTLQVLKIRNCNFHRRNFEGFLRLSGSNLISLELHHISSIDLSCILNHCVNIKRLHVSGDSVMDRTLGNMTDAAKALQSLEVLHLDCRFSASSTERMLHACVNVKRLHLNLRPGHITDEFILRLLSHNPLQKLTSFAAHCPKLTMKSLNAIIDHCPLLEKLECVLTEIGAISYLEIKCLRETIADKNQDLQIILS